jgi:hypothetical protein
MEGHHDVLQVIEGQGVNDVAHGPRELRVGHFELPHTISQTIAQREFHLRACGRTLKRCLNLPSQAVQRLSSVSIEIVCLGEFRAEASYQRTQRLF